jgi:hypothetical protein
LPAIPMVRVRVMVRVMVRVRVRARNVLALAPRFPAMCKFLD